MEPPAQVGFPWTASSGAKVMAKRVDGSAGGAVWGMVGKTAIGAWIMLATNATSHTDCSPSYAKFC